MGYKLNGCDTGGFPFYLIKSLIENNDVPYFCETGTAGGESIRLAAPMFKKVWTIELLEGVVDYKGAPKNISFLNGDSVNLLPVIIKELIKLKGDKERQWVLFFLDAHYTDVVPNESGYPECPVLDEIRAVSKYGEDAIIIIDDARLFLGSPPYPNSSTEWPSICDIFVLLKECFPYHHITITDDFVLAIPLHVRSAIDEEWRSRFHIRYPNDNDKLRQQVKDVHKAFMRDVYAPFMEYLK